MNWQQREELARKIGMFLVGKGLKVWDIWVGRLTKKEQLEAFGFYLGKGLIEVDGETDGVKMSIKIAFGQDIDVKRGISARFDEHGLAPAFDNDCKSQFRDYCNQNNITIN